MATLHLSDTEVDDMCQGLTQDAAKVRFLRRLGLKVDRKPNVAIQDGVREPVAS